MFARIIVPKNYETQVTKLINIWKKLDNCPCPRFQRGYGRMPNEMIIKMLGTNYDLEDVDVLGSWTNMNSNQILYQVRNDKESGFIYVFEGRRISMYNCIGSLPKVLKRKVEDLQVIEYHSNRTDWKWYNKSEGEFYDCPDWAVIKLTEEEEEKQTEIQRKIENHLEITGRCIHRQYRFFDD